MHRPLAHSGRDEAPGLVLGVWRVLPRVAFTMRRARGSAIKRLDSLAALSSVIPRSIYAPDSGRRAVGREMPAGVWGAFIRQHQAEPPCASAYRCLLQRRPAGIGRVAAVIARDALDGSLKTGFPVSRCRAIAARYDKMVAAFLRAIYRPYIRLLVSPGSFDDVRQTDKRILRADEPLSRAASVCLLLSAQFETNIHSC